mmetsp:Transcript_6526/g.21029  ORF Transcript_6526/g.21029 Transcript_6526/m.21029 type:complete len:246 (+) Transcript_6526:1375-2112(+)
MQSSAHRHSTRMVSSSSTSAATAKRIGAMDGAFGGPATAIAGRVGASSSPPSSCESSGSVSVFTSWLSDGADHRAASVCAWPPPPPPKTSLKKDAATTPELRGRRRHWRTSSRKRMRSCGGVRCSARRRSAAWRGETSSQTSKNSKQAMALASVSAGGVRRWHVESSTTPTPSSTASETPVPSQAPRMRRPTPLRSRTSSRDLASTATTSTSPGILGASRFSILRRMRACSTPRRCSASTRETTT